MDELEKRSQKGLNEFKKQGSIDDVKSSLDSMVDGMFDDPDDVGNEALNRSPSPNSGGKKWILIALAISALAILGYMGFREGSSARSKEVKLEPKVLFAQYFEPMEDLTDATQRGSSELVSDSDVGMELYNEGDYKGAATLLLGQDDNLSQVYGALALLNDGQFDRAKKLLSDMMIDEDYKDFNDIIAWYLALAELSEGNSVKAKTQLKSIAHSSSFKKKAATELLSKF